MEIKKAPVKRALVWRVARAGYATISLVALILDHRGIESRGDFFHRCEDSPACDQREDHDGAGFQARLDGSQGYEEYPHDQGKTDEDNFEQGILLFCKSGC